MATMRIERAKVGWRVWLGWMLACAASAAVALTVTGAMVRAGSPNAAVVWAVFGLVIGASLGITQWLVLRRQIPRAYMWLLASAVGGAVAGILGFAMGGPAGGPLGGAVIGAIPGFLKGRFNTNEIVVTMMLNSIAFWLIAYMIKEGGPFMGGGGEGEGFKLAQSVIPPMVLGGTFTIPMALGLAALL